MKTIRLMFSLLLLGAASCLVTVAHAAERAGIKGILLTASSQAGETDRRLAPYEANLRRILRFESFRFLGEGSTTLNVPEKGELSIGDGHQLEIETENSDGRAIHIKVRWVAGGRTLMNTSLVLRPGVPAVLGGPSTGNRGEVYGVILIAR